MNEEYQQSDKDIKIGTDRAFGLVFALFFGVLYAWQLWHGMSKHWLLGCALFFVLSALIWPVLLHPLNRLWFKLGLLLHAVTTPLILGIIFFVIVSPTGILMRVIGKRPLHLSKDSGVSTYWVTRPPHEPTDESFRNQF